MGNEITNDQFPLPLSATPKAGFSDFGKAASSPPFLIAPGADELKALHAKPVESFKLAPCFSSPELSAWEEIYQTKSAAAVSVILKALRADYFRSFDELLVFAASQRKKVQAEIIQLPNFPDLKNSSELEKDLEKIGLPRLAEMPFITAFDDLPKTYQERFKKINFGESEFQEGYLSSSSEIIPLIKRSNSGSYFDRQNSKWVTISTGFIEHSSVENFGKIRIELEGLFNEYKSKKPKTLEAFQTILRIYWWLTNATFFQKGSESISDYVLAALLSNKGFNDFKVPSTTNLSLEAYLKDQVDFLNFLIN